LPDSQRHPDPFVVDPEKTPVRTTSVSSIPGEFRASAPSVAVLSGRPNVDLFIRDIVAKAADDERIGIGACGPDGLMWDVRKTATNCIGVNGPSIELHCEQFGW
jgi:hypothetical protein